MFNNPLLLTDSYKVSHYRQYPPKTETIYSYFESRGSDKWDETVFFGLQYFLKRYLTAPITWKMIEQARDIYKLHFGDETMFNLKGWAHILDAHGGKLPVRIKAVPEGSVIPTRNVLMAIENLDPECDWLTNWLETLLVNVWYPVTVASISRENKKVIAEALEESGDPAELPFKLHDFGCRGVTCPEQAGLGGCAHLVNFLSTDNVPALQVGQEIYGEPMAGFSIPAAEHSTITSWGQQGEGDAFKNMLVKYPKGLVAVVSDSFDIYKACEGLWGNKLKDMVMEREGTVIVRPDSGDPLEVLPKILEILGDKLGYETNGKGYKVLDSHIRIIQGDKVCPDTVPAYYNVIMDAGWSANNMALGSGGGLLQKMDRDTYNFAFKCSWAQVDGKGRDVYKKPVGSAWKASKKGRLKLVADRAWRDYGTAPYYTTVAESAKGDDILQTVYENGELLIDQTLAEIRERAAL